jgi:hypothetical protein
MYLQWERSRLCRSNRSDVFFGHSLRRVPFLRKEAAAMEKNYFLDTLFDIINESDTLEVDIQDIQTARESLIVTMKDGTVFRLTITEE